MSFASITDMLERAPATELAQLADRSTPRVVTGPMLTAAAANIFSGLTDDQVTAVNTVLARLQALLDEATEIARGYVLPVYPGVLSLQPVPGILIRVCCDVARYNLYDVNTPDLVKDRFTAAMQSLRDISRGVITLGEEAAVSQSIGSADDVTIISDPVHMTRRRGRTFL